MMWRATTSMLPPSRNRFPAKVTVVSAASASSRRSGWRRCRTACSGSPRPDRRCPGGGETVVDAGDRQVVDAAEQLDHEALTVVGEAHALERDAVARARDLVDEVADWGDPVEVDDVVAGRALERHRVDRPVHVDRLHAGERQRPAVEGEDAIAVVGADGVGDRARTGRRGRRCRSRRSPPLIDRSPHRRR